MSSLVRSYVMVTKPGIVLGNIITALCGLGLAGAREFALIAWTLLGLTLVMGAGCVFNNCIDRLADQKMNRTKTRPTATGELSTINALVYGSCLTLAGLWILAHFANILTATVALIGFIDYVLIYSFLKYRSTLATAVGSIAGATPPVVGYVAVTGSFDLGAMLLFIFLALWQMPHFYAIAMMRMKEYEKAAIPVLPLVKGALATKIHIILYIIAFMGACALITYFGFVGNISLLAALLLGGIWLYMAFQGLSVKSDPLWARNMFLYSLVVITALCSLIGLRL